MTDRDRSLESLIRHVTEHDERVVELGRYQLLRVIGRGGMGQVFEAWDTQLERRVAIKVLTAEHSDDLALREARCVARVAHPNVVAVHEVGRAESLMFIAMEFVDGPDLRQWLREPPRRWSDVLDQVIAAGRGLAAVHDAGLVHGDVKPGNVLVGGDGRVRIADFGLARVRSRLAKPGLVAVVRRAAAVVETEMVDADQPTLESSPCIEIVRDERGRVEGVGGTKPYMAPECLSGVREGHVRADQYSLCAMAWEALFGVRPYAGATTEAILGSIAGGRLERGRGRPRGMPRSIEIALLRGLSEVPHQRWPSVSALLAVLTRDRERPRRRVRRRVGVVVCGLGLAGISLGLGQPSVGARDTCGAGVTGLESRPRLLRSAISSLEQLRFEALLERVRLGQAKGELRLDELTALDELSQRVDVDLETRVELALMRALALAREPSAGIDRLTRALRSVDGSSALALRLRLRIVLTRGQLQLDAGRVGAALRDALAARALAERGVDLDRGLLGQAYVLLAQSSARAGRCDLSVGVLDGLRPVIGEYDDPVAALTWVLEIAHAFALNPDCRDLHEWSWGLVNKLMAADEDPL